MAAHTIYIIDDDHDVRSSIAFMLGTTGRNCVAFSGGPEFLDSIGDLQAGCVLLDVRMPQMGGLDVLAELLRRGIEWPVIVMTGHGEGDLATQAMKLGAVDFLEKPFDADLLLSCLDRCCRSIPD